MTTDLAEALDRYERDVARRVGTLSARDLRRELEAHLAADIAARTGVGIVPEVARAEALAALGDLRVAARAERAPHGRFGRILLFAAPGFASLAWYLPQWIVIRHGVLPDWASSAMGLTFLVAGTLGTVLARRLNFGTILIGALSHGLLIGAGLIGAGGPMRVFPFALSISAAVAAFGLVATFALHLVVHLLIFGLPSLRDRTGGTARV